MDKAKRGDRFMDKRILVIDDALEVHQAVWESIRQSDILVYHSENIDEVMDVIERVDFDLFFIDIALSNVRDVYFLIQSLRKSNPLTPIIILRTDQTEAEIITALEIGADLYIDFPVSNKLFETQIMSILIRINDIYESKRTKKCQYLKVGNFEFDYITHQLYKNNKPIKLSSKELKLMLFFMEHSNQVFTKEEIFEQVWDKKEYDKNAVMVLVNHLRIKIEENVKNPEYLQTIWGVGYTFMPKTKK